MYSDVNDSFTDDDTIDRGNAEAKTTIEVCIFSSQSPEPCPQARTLARQITRTPLYSPC